MQASTLSILTYKEQSSSLLSKDLCNIRSACLTLLIVKWVKETSIYFYTDSQSSLEAHQGHQGHQGMKGNAKQPEKGSLSHSKDPEPWTTLYCTVFCYKKVLLNQAWKTVVIHETNNSRDRNPDQIPYKVPLDSLRNLIAFFKRLRLKDSPVFRRCDAEDETSCHLLSTCPGRILKLRVAKIEHIHAFVNKALENI